jgi:2-keto-4-pentenoate hydratase
LLEQQSTSSATVSSDIVDSFLHARSERPYWRPVPTEQRPSTIEEGYRVQRAVHEVLDASGNRLVGYKVGATSIAGQKAFGLNEPTYAGMFAQGQSPDLASALPANLIAPSIECEVAFRLRSDIDVKSGDFSPEKIIEAIGGCYIACEVVDNRYGNPMEVGVPCLLADDFFHVGFVLGEARDDWRSVDFTNLNASIVIDGTVYRGHSSDVLDALTSLSWLSQKLCQAGYPLRAGDVVLTGTIVPPTRITLPVRSVILSIDGFAQLSMG